MGSREEEKKAVKRSASGNTAGRPSWHESLALPGGMRSEPGDEKTGG